MTVDDFKWIVGGLGAAISICFGITMKKVDRDEFKEFKDRQCQVNDKFEEALKANTEMLGRVDERLKAGGN